MPVGHNFEWNWGVGVHMLPWWVLAVAVVIAAVVIAAAALVFALARNTKDGDS
jgi:hypothetical protein